MDIAGFSLWYQALLLTGILVVFIGYFQYRKRNGDVLEVGREMMRPSYLISIGVVVIAYIILRVVFHFLGKVL